MAPQLLGDVWRTSGESEDDEMPGYRTGMGLVEGLVSEDLGFVVRLERANIVHLGGRGQINAANERTIRSCSTLKKGVEREVLGVVTGLPDPRPMFEIDRCAEEERRMSKGADRSQAADRDCRGGKWQPWEATAAGAGEVFVGYRAYQSSACPLQQSLVPSRPSLCKSRVNAVRSSLFSLPVHKHQDAPPYGTA